MRSSTTWIIALALALVVGGCSAINDFGQFEFGAVDAGTDATVETDAGDGTCDDLMQNGDETDVDCGGAECDLCLDGDSCLDDSDCDSDFCDSSGVCAAGSCMDNEVNQDETDVDCGGATCDACGDGLSCGVNTDCMSGLCVGGTCSDSGCTDSIMNGEETDVDCGGTVCPGCRGGEMCGAGTDCRSTVCTAGSCEASACDDTILNGDETDLDCGGPDCAGCADGLMCVAGTDCASSACEGNVCVSCTDTLMNQDETDVDCGGATCGGCDDGRTCALGTDCTSGVCDALTCASCSDGRMNQDETDVDCGGSVCGPCRHGDMCTVGGDCAGVCTAGRCVEEGHAVLIGHDFFARSAAADRVLRNSILLTDDPGDIEVLIYTEFADRSASGEVANTVNAINAEMVAAGRTANVMQFTNRAMLPTLLPGADVFIVAEQESGAPATLTTVAAGWNNDINTFLARGGVIISLNHVDPGWRVLNGRGMFDIGGPVILPLSATLQINLASDPIASGVGAYATPNGSSRWDRLFGGVTVVDTPANEPVVQHLIYRRVMFAGFATFSQTPAMTDVQQDAGMNTACRVAFSGSRAASVDEITLRLVDGLPATNTSGSFLVPAMPRGAGAACGTCADGHSRNCVNPGLAFPSGAGWSGNPNCNNGTRSTVCVRP